MTPITVPPRFVDLLDELERFELTPRDRDEARHHARFAVSAPVPPRETPVVKLSPAVPRPKPEQALKAPKGFITGARPPSKWLRAARDLMEQAEAEGCRSYSAIARWMTERGHESAHGGNWTQMMVGRTYDPDDEKRRRWTDAYHQQIAEAWELAEASDHEFYTAKAIFLNEMGLKTERNKAWTDQTAGIWHRQYRGRRLPVVTGSIEIVARCVGGVVAFPPSAAPPRNDFVDRLASFETGVRSALWRAKAVGAKTPKQTADFLNGIGMRTFYGDAWDESVIDAWRSLHG